MEKRTIIAIALSILVIAVWQKFVVEKYSTKTQILSQETVEGSKGSAIENYPSGPEENAIQKEKIPEEEYVFETNQFVVTLSNIGGCIKKIGLKEYKSEEGKGPYTLMSSDKIGKGIFTIKSDELSFDNDTVLYSLKVKNDTVEYSTVLQNQIRIIKRYIFNEQDLINFYVAFENLSSQMYTFGYDIIGGVDISAKNPLTARYLEVNSKVNNTIYRNRRIKNDILLHQGEAQWSSLMNDYFVLILKPFNASQASFVKKYDDKTLGSGIRMAEASLSPGSKIEHKFLLYAGPKKSDRLASFGMGFEQVIYYGAFGSISELLLSLIRFFYKLTHNWGTSIIILAALMNIIFLPLTRVSLVSTRKMQALQPEIKELQEKYKKNPQKLNKEIMELYKKRKVNPFSGCLPMMLQLPVFIALYQGLIRFIELKESSFLWIKDLSLPDTVKLNFLGGSPIHILPILMAAVMFLQQKLSYPQNQAGTTEQQKQQQKMMLIMMPLLFGFIFYNFPSGLVLYWFTNTIFMTLYQILIIKKGV